MAAPHPRPLGILCPELPRLRTARFPRCPLQAIWRQVLVVSKSVVFVRSKEMDSPTLRKFETLPPLPVIGTPFIVTDTLSPESIKSTVSARALTASRLPSPFSCRQASEMLG